MNKRAITWLLAALLALAANASVPPSRVRSAGGDSAIVWIAQHRAEQRVPLCPRVFAIQRQVSSLPYLSPANPRPPVAALYQRPPPSLR